MREPSSGRHGYGPYTNGCRCDVCKKAKADYIRERRAHARALAQKYTVSSNGKQPNGFTAFEPGASRNYIANITHGTRYAYEERGCRCLDCTTARTTSDRSYRSKETT